MTDFPDELKALPKFRGAEDAKVYDITGLKAENGWQILFSNYDAGFALDEHTHDSENLGIVLEGELHFTPQQRDQILRTGGMVSGTKGSTPFRILSSGHPVNRYFNASQGYLGTRGVHVSILHSCLMSAFGPRADLINSLLVFRF